MFPMWCRRFGDVAQLVERRTGTPLTQVRFPGAARDFSPGVNFQRRLCYGVRTMPCAIACTRMCVHVKDPVVHSVDYGGTKTNKKANKHWKLTPGEKSLATPGNRTCLSSVQVWCSAKQAMCQPHVWKWCAEVSHTVRTLKIFFFKSETELTASVLKKDPKYTRD